MKMSKTIAEHQDKPLLEADLIPLIPAQERVWVISQTAKNNVFSNHVITCEMDPCISVADLASKVKNLIGIFPLLHSKLVSQGDKWLWQKQPIEQSQVTTHQCQRDSFDDYLNAHRNQWYDLTRCVAMQAKLVKIDTDIACLVVTIPHIVCDKTSCDLLRYWLENSGLAGSHSDENTLSSSITHPQGASLARQTRARQTLATDNAIKYQGLDDYFMAFAQAFDRHQNSDTLAGQRQFWTQYLSEEIPQLDLPLDKPRQSVQNFNCCRTCFTLDKTHFLHFKAHYPACDDAYVYLLTAVSLLLHRYTQQSRFSLGILGNYADTAARISHFLDAVSAVDAESPEGLDKNQTAILGQFDNLTTLICQVEAAQNFADLYCDTKQRLADLAAHQDIAFETALNYSNAHRSVSVSPLFQVLVTNHFTDFNNNKAALSQTLAISELASPFDMTIGFLAEDEACFHISVDYNRDLFHASTISHFTDCLQVLLASVAHSPSDAVSKLSILNERDAKAQLDFFQQNLQVTTSQNRDPKQHSLYQIFAQNLALNGARPAVMFNAETLTYAQLNERVCDLANRLSVRLHGSAQFIGVALPRGIDFIVAVLAISKLGKAYVPMDHKQPVQHLQFIVNDAQLSQILVSHDDPATGSQQHKLSALFEAECLNIHELSEQPAEANSECDLASQARHKDQQASTQADAAYIIYTSGSKGQAKAVIGSQRSLLNRLAWMARAFPCQEHDVLCHRTPVNFVDHVAEIFQAFYCAKPLLIVPEDSFLDCEQVIRLLQQHKVTRITLVPSLLQLLLDTGLHNLSEQLDYVFCSGDALTLGLAQRFFAKLWNTRLINVYGSTECGADICYHEVQFGDGFQLLDLFSSTPRLAHEPISSGSIAVQHETDDPVLPYTKANVELDELIPKFTSTALRTTPMSLGSYKDLLKLDVLPYSVNVSSGKFIGHMTSALPDFIGELSSIVAQLNQNMVKIETSKAFTLLERQVLATLHRLFFQREIDGAKVQDPHCVYGLVVSGGSIANITAMWCARNCALMKLGASKDDIRELGVAHLMAQYHMQDSVIICSRLAHYSVKKAASLMGLGERHILRINQTEDQKVDVAHLAELVAECRRDRRLVIAIIGIAGATETGIFDPIPDMGKVARDNHIHFHVDAAWGGALVFSKQYRSKLAGVSAADSVTFCAHKQMYVPQGVSVCLFQDPTLIHASSVHASYQGQQGSFDLGQYTLEGSRPAISLTLHAILNVLSKDQLAWLIDQGIKKAAYFGKVIDQSDEFELLAVPEINILNYRYIPKALRRAKTDPQHTTYEFSAAENAHISQVVQDIQAQQFLNGKTFVSKTTIAHPRHQEQQITVFRVVLANPLTKYEDLHANLIEQINIANHIIEQQDVNILPAIAPSYKENEQVRQALPIGQPIDNCAVYVLDKHMQLLPQGAVGEICVSGAGLSLGYLNQANKQASQFVPHPFRAGEKIYRTGDLGRYLVEHRQGSGSPVIQFLGRKDDRVKINGVRIELLEVASYLSRLPQIKACQVVVDSTIASEKKLVAFWVRSDSAEHMSASAETPATLRRKLLEFTPTYLVPNRFIECTSLPKSSSGKVMDSTLIQSLDKVQNDVDDTGLTSTESALGKLWAELLNVESVARQDNFFALGGDSIAAAKLLVFVRSKFNVDMPFFTLFETDCLTDMAASIDRAAI